MLDPRGEKIWVDIKKYPYFVLKGRIYESDLEEWDKTHNEDIVLYRQCH